MEDLLAIIYGSIFSLLFFVVAIFFFRIAITAITERNSPEARTGLMNCKACGKKVSTSASFCPSCGEKLGLEGFYGLSGFILAMIGFILFLGFAILIGNVVYQDLKQRGILPSFELASVTKFINLNQENSSKSATSTSQENNNSLQTTTFDANGTYMVNDEIKPGIYKSEGNITYWARLKNFEGEDSSILAAGTPQGSSAVVEIKKSDAGFQTQGDGKWFLIDDSYKPEKLKKFGDGTYIVGKDIDPGTYRSDGSGTYWARLKNFAEDGIIADNGTKSGKAIVTIKSTDKGFMTHGGATWTKIK